MNSKNIELMELMEARKELKETEAGIWNMIPTALGGSFVFSGGCIGSYYLIKGTPHWVFWMGIVAAILTVLFCLFVYAWYKETKKKKKTVENELRRLKAEIRERENKSD